MKEKLRTCTFLIAILLASNAMAGSVFFRHTVKIGDTLWGLSMDHKVTVAAIKDANPKIQGTTIVLGSELNIPSKASADCGYNQIAKSVVHIRVTAKKIRSVSATNRTGSIKRSNAVSPNSRVVFLQKDWTDPGANKYRGILSRDLPILDYSAQAQTGLRDAILSGKYVWATINPKDKGGLVVDENGHKYKIKKMLSGGGIKRPVQVLTGQNNEQVYLDNRRDSLHAEAGKIYSFGNNYLLFPLACDNPSLIERVGGLSEEVTVAEEATATLTEKPSTSTPPYMQIPLGEKPQGFDGKDRDRRDLYFGGGTYENRIDPSDNDGWYWWLKGRERPAYFDVEENSLGIKSYGLGFVGFAAGGEGVAAKYYEYDWYNLALGGTAKVYAKNSDYDFDAMVFRLLNEGTWMGTGGNKQVDYGLLLSAHGNFYRDSKSPILPKWEVNIEGRFPFSTDVKRGEKTNNRVVEINFIQWLYKFDIDKEDSLSISPGLNLGAGYEWSADDETFVKAGPSVEFSSHKNVIGAVSPYNYKWQGDGQRHPISGYVSPDGIYNAWKASQVTAISEEELRGLKGSILLANPADYLD